VVTTPDRVVKPASNSAPRTATTTRGVGAAIWIGERSRRGDARGLEPVAAAGHLGGEVRGAERGERRVCNGVRSDLDAQTAERAYALAVQQPQALCADCRVPVVGGSKTARDRERHVRDAAGRKDRGRDGQEVVVAVVEGDERPALWKGSPSAQPRQESAEVDEPISHPQHRVELRGELVGGHRVPSESRRGRSAMAWYAKT
jgi:hypothetical protein